MADDIDRAGEHEEAHRQASLASHKPVQLDPGVPGYCDSCGNHFPRLIRGHCGRCRDKLRLP